MIIYIIYPEVCVILVFLCRCTKMWKTHAILLRKLLCNNMVEGGQLEHYGILNFIEILYALSFLDMFP